MILLSELALTANIEKAFFMTSMKDIL